MKLRDQKSGLVFEISALELPGGRCPAAEYLDGLRAKDANTYESMLGKIDYRSDHLVMKSSRQLTGKRYHGLYRLSQGAERLIYMFLPHRSVVLLNGYDKNNVEKTEYERARQYQIDLLNQISEGK